MTDSADSGRRYWIGVVSRSHIMKGVKAGFVQLNHGSPAPLRRMHRGDGPAIYSPRTDYPDGGPLQAFTAAGVIKDDRVYQADMGDGFTPFRRDVAFLPCQETPVKDLIPQLSFIRKKESWGAAFRFGHLRVPEVDFTRIVSAMDCRFPGPAVPAGNM